MNQSTERLYNLLPAIYRQRDFAQGEPLRALLAVMEKELQIIEADIEGLYDNWFIETCDSWVMPYIAELLGIEDLNDEKQIIFSQRTRIANTIRYRRRKGTTATLEMVVQDVTGWKARVVEYFDYIATTQHLSHIRPGKGGTFDLRRTDALERLDSPFNTAAHTIDIRPFESNRGRYNIPSVGVFLWRLESYPVRNSNAYAITEQRNVAYSFALGQDPERFQNTIVAVPSASTQRKYTFQVTPLPNKGRYTFHPLGYDLPLFNRPQTRTEFSEVAAAINVPQAIAAQAFQEELQDYYGDLSSVTIIKNGQLIPLDKVEGRDLRNWSRPSEGKTVAVDVDLGRLTFAEGEDPEPDQLQVSYNYGFSADLGGGPYSRRQSLTQSSGTVWFVSKSHTPKSEQWFTSLQGALKEWVNRGKLGIIRIMDNSTYYTPLQLSNLKGLVIEAADGACPSIHPVDGKLTVVGAAAGSTLNLNGLLIKGAIAIQGNLRLNLTHCTVMAEEGQASIVVEEGQTADLQLMIRHSIVGPLRLPPQSANLTIQDSIIDGGGKFAIASVANNSYGPPTTLARTTVFGQVAVQEIILASETIFTDTVTVEQRQVGGIRFSYVPSGSQTPNRYQCQPDLFLEQEAQRLGRNSIDELTAAETTTLLTNQQPVFTSLNYGQPGYGQLTFDTPEGIRTGAENGSEMGAFNPLVQPQRQANLKAALNEYLRFGLQVGVFYVT